MIKITNLLPTYIQEAVKWETYKKFASLGRSKVVTQKLNDIFQELIKLPNATQSKRGDRIYIPLPSSTTKSTPKSSLQDEIEKILNKEEYKIKDYKKGIATDPYDREIKIPKAIIKLKNLSPQEKKKLIDNYSKDENREGAKLEEKNQSIVFSKHPYDITGASTGRGWTSCMNLYTDKQGDDYLQYDIEEGVIVAYLINSKDTNIENPTARIFLKPFILYPEEIDNPDLFDEDKELNVDDIIYSTQASQVYGTTSSNFQSTIENIFRKIQNTSKAGRFELNANLYCDREAGKNIFKFPKTDNKELQKVYDYITKTSNLPQDKKSLNIIVNNPEKFKTIADPAQEYVWGKINKISTSTPISGKLIEFFYSLDDFELNMALDNYFEKLTKEGIVVPEDLIVSLDNVGKSKLAEDYIYNLFYKHIINDLLARRKPKITIPPYKGYEKLVNDLYKSF